MNRAGLKRIIKEIVKLTNESFTSGRKYVVVYAISGLENIEPSEHRSKADAMMAAKHFMDSANGPGSKRAGERVVKTNEGYILKDASGATVGIATIVEPRGTGAGDEFQQQNEHLNEIDFNNQLIKIQKICPHCKKTNTIMVDRRAYSEWRAGKLIQQAFPNLSNDQREILKTGICPKCWDELFSDM